MLVMRTAEDMARALDSPLDTELKCLLADQHQRLSEWQDYTFEEFAMIVIVQPGDTLDAINAACGWSLLNEGAADFASPVARRWPCEMPPPNGPTSAAGRSSRSSSDIPAPILTSIIGHSLARH